MQGTICIPHIKAYVKPSKIEWAPFTLSIENVFSQQYIQSVLDLHRDVITPAFKLSGRARNLILSSCFMTVRYALYELAPNSYCTHSCICIPHNRPNWPLRSSCWKLHTQKEPRAEGEKQMRKWDYLRNHHTTMKNQKTKTRKRIYHSHRQPCRSAMLFSLRKVPLRIPEVSEKASFWMHQWTLS